MEVESNYLYSYDNLSDLTYSNTKKIEVKKSRLHGRGVFAKEKIRKGEVIEFCPVLVLKKEDIEFIDKTNLYNYYFDWKHSIAIALGYGSFYNHSYTPNAYYKKDFENEQLIFIALKDIEVGEEITINYNGYPCCKDKLWFE